MNLEREAQFLTAWRRGVSIEAMAQIFNMSREAVTKLARAWGYIEQPAPRARTRT